jgi:hypothetical protein
MFAPVVRKGTHVNRSSFSLSSLARGTSVGALVAILVAYTGCSSSPNASFGVGDDDGDAAPSNGDDGGSSGNDSGYSSDGQAAADSSGHDSSAADSSSGADSGVADTSAPDTSSPDTGTVTSDDGFGAVRTACINEINRLRATQSLTAYTLVNTDSINTCVDAQATSDEASGVAHQAWGNGNGPCDGNGQDECEGYGNDASGMVMCLDSMWDEKNNSNCLGCVGCTQFGGACPNCDFYGMNGPECGHYVNMSSVQFTEVACGFAAAPGTWSAQNFFITPP